MNTLNQASKLKEIEDNYFVRMMLPDAEKKASPYIEEERLNVMNLLKQIENAQEMNFIVIGAGTLWYIELVYDQVKTYIAIEPLADIFIQKQLRYLLTKHPNIKVIDKELGDFESSDLPSNNSVFVFHFNILAYIPDPLEKINKYIKKGDIIYISSWGTSEKARTVRKNYFEYLNLNVSQDSFKIDPDDTIGLCNLDIFPFQKLKHYKRHERIKGEIADMLIIYC